MKKSLVCLIALAGIGAPSSMVRAESLVKVGQAREQRRGLVEFLQARIVRHEGMTKEQIIADLTKTAERNREIAARSHEVDMSAYDRAMAQTLQSFNEASSAEELVLLEKAQLQQVLSSENIMFMFTRGALESAVTTDVARDAGLWFLLAIPCIPLDVIMLPYTFIGSLLTGF